MRIFATHFAAVAYARVHALKEIAFARAFRVANRRRISVDITSHNSTKHAQKHANKT